MRKWLFVVPLLFCAACTTIEDFQAMTPDERAEEVCGATSAARQRRSALMQINDQISVQQALLSNGYRVYEDCQVVPVYVPATVVNCTGKSGNDLDKCQQQNTQAHTEYRRVCRQTAIPINYSYESGILRNLQMAKADQVELDESLKANCLDRARLLSPTEAYSVYLKNAEP